MPHSKLSEQLRRIVLNCGESRYSLWIQTGIDQATLSRFINGKRPLTMNALDTLGEHLGLEIVVKTPRKRKS